jgi:hypothetical protein
MYFDRIGDQDLIGFFDKDSIGYRSGVTKLGKERDWSATTKKRNRVQPWIFHNKNEILLNNFCKITYTNDS